MSWSEVPFQTAPGLVRYLVGQVRRHKDAMVACHGGEGTGKSTTAKNLVKELEKALGVKAITIFKTDQLLVELADGKKGQIYVLDEAINVFHNQDWASWQSKALTKVMRQNRIMESIWLLNVPDFEGLHPYLRDYRVPIRLYHPPIYTPDGLGNGPAKLLFKQERFGYQSQRVEYRWNDCGDIHSWCMDDEPDWKQYEQDKVANFKELIASIMERQEKENAKETGKTKKKRQTGKNRPAPPIATQ